MKKILFFILFCFAFLSNTQSQQGCDIVVMFASTNVSLDANGEFELDPEMVTFGDISQCDYSVALVHPIDYDNILIPYGPTILITCEFIGDYVVVVRDNDSGNSAWGNISIEDMLGSCPLYFGPDTYSLIYTTRNFGGIMDTEVALNGNPVAEVYDYLDTIPKSDLIDGENVLSFPPTTGTIDLNTSGITVFDVVEISKMFVFDVEYPLRAVLGDVDGSGYLNVNDMVVLREYILGVPNVTLADNFLFKSKTYQFDSDFDPFDFTDLNFREYRFDKDAVTQDDLEFFVYQYGDIVGGTTDITDSLSNDEVTNRSTQTLIIENRDVTAGATIQVPMTIHSDDFDIKGLQLGMAFNGLELKDIQHNYVGSELMFNDISNNDFRISYVDPDGDTEFNVVLEFDVLQSGTLKDMISLNDDFIQESVGYENTAMIQMDFKETSSVKEIDDIVAEMIGNELIINFPTIHTNRVVVYDIQGRVINTIQPNSDLVKLDMSGFNDGMFFVSTIVEGRPFTQKIVLIN